MLKELCEAISMNPTLVRDCWRLFDERTRTRLGRENEQTWKGLVTLKKRQKTIKKQALKLQQRNEYEIEENETRSARESREIQVAKWTGERAHKDYRFTKWSRLKINRIRKENERWQAYAYRYKKWKFFTSLIKLKITLSRKEWEHSCHSKAREIIRQNVRLKNILRIRWKYGIDEGLPPDSEVFDKLINYEKEKEKRLKLRQERMIKIIQNIGREMNNGIRIKKPTNIRPKKIQLEEISEESLTEMSIEEARNEVYPAEERNSKDVRETKKSAEKTIEKGPREDKKVKDEKDVELDKEQIISVGKENVKEFTVFKGSKSLTEKVFPQDTCFFAIPSIVTFTDFEAKKLYYRKVLIRNKTTKWAYLRFHKIYTEIWEPGVVEIDIVDAAKVQPGLDVSVNVKFSPFHEKDVRADIAFLTLTADDTKTFHEFRVPVRCTSQNPVLIVEPKELGFPSAPIWKYNDVKFNKRILTIFNDGKKSCSIMMEETNDRDHCFVWSFEQGKIYDVDSSVSHMIKDQNGEENTENADENATNGEEFRKMYQIEVPSKFQCNLTISFRPKYIGLHHEVLEIYFLNDNRIFGKQDVPIWTEVTGYQIHTDPPCVDLGIVTIDSDISQQTFNIINTGRTNTEVSIKIPKRLGDQVSVYPKSTIVQTEVASTIAVKLMPESNIVEIAKRFYDPVSSMLEFPIKIEMLSQDQVKPPPLTVKVLASLTTCHGLILEPAYIDLGFVYTHESVYTELTLTNESLLIQEYAFLNLPSSVEIHPNHGFGAILPGETINLHLIYSACLTDIPGNEIGENGLAGDKSFFIRVISLAELARGKKQTILNKLKDRIHTQPIVPRHRGLPPPLPVDLRTPKSTRRKGDRNKDDLEDHLGNYPTSNEEDPDKEETVDTSTEDFGRTDRRKEKNVTEIYAYILDALCELSEQIIKLPATPCGSFSLSAVQLRGFNAASYPNCTCGLIKNQNKEFTARYEFKSSSDRLKIMPQSGVLRSEEVIEVNFLFKPRLPKSMIFEEGLRLKMNVEQGEMKSEKDDKSPNKNGKMKRRKTVKREGSDKKKEISDEDKLAGEISLLETFEPCVSTISVTCAIDLETKNGTKHDQLLFAKLICPITRPEILLLNEDRELSFGSTAIGTSITKFLLVKNISNQSAKVEVSLLDPFGPFFVPPGRTIETGSVLSLPVTYRPMRIQEEENEEYFEVFSSKSRTRWNIKVLGRGVVPSYVLKPQFRVARLEVTDDKPAELRMSVENTGSCPLTFRLYLTDVLEGEIPRKQEEQPEQPTEKKNQKKGRSERAASSAKSPTKAQFESKLQPNEELAIFGGNLQQSENRSCFSFFNVNENMQIVVPEKKKLEFGIRFQLSSEKTISDSKGTTATASRRKKKTKAAKKEGERKKLDYCHVAMGKLMLGGATLNDFVMICSAK